MAQSFTNQSVEQARHYLSKYWGAAPKGQNWDAAFGRAMGIYVQRYGGDDLKAEWAKGERADKTKLLEQFLAEVKQTEAEQEALSAAGFHVEKDGIRGQDTRTAEASFIRAYNQKGLLFNGEQLAVGAAPDAIIRATQIFGTPVVKAQLAPRVALVTGDVPDMPALSRTYSTADINVRHLEVMKAQMMLSALGSHGTHADKWDFEKTIGTLDGRLGGAFERTVSKFQTDAGLPVTGVLDKETWNGLHAAVSELPAEVRANIEGTIQTMRAAMEIKALPASKRFTAATDRVAAEFGLSANQKHSMSMMPVAHRLDFNRSRTITSVTTGEHGPDITGTASTYGPAHDGGRAASGTTFHANKYMFASTRGFYSEERSFSDERHDKDTARYPFMAVYSFKKGDKEIWAINADSGNYGAKAYRGIGGDDRRSFDLSTKLMRDLAGKSGGLTRVSASYAPEMTLAYWRRQQLMGERVPELIATEIHKYLSDKGLLKGASLEEGQRPEGLAEIRHAGITLDPGSHDQTTIRAADVSHLPRRTEPEAGRSAVG